MALKSQAATEDGLDAMNTIANNGFMNFYDGAVPATADAGATNLLGTIALEAVAFDPATVDATEASADLAIGAQKQTTAILAGVCTYYRIVGPTSIIAHQGTVGTSGEALNFDDNDWNIGGVIDVTALTVTLAVPNT